jgi:hypothetical protein
MANVNTKKSYPSQKGKHRSTKKGHRAGNTSPVQPVKAKPTVKRHKPVFYDHRLVLMPQEDVGRVFLKVLNEDECHKGFQWVEGLNVDTKPFDRVTGCGPGGLYFTDVDNAHLFIDDSITGARYIRRVAPVLDNGEFARVDHYTQCKGAVNRVKWKAHEVHAGPRMDLNALHTWKALFSLCKSRPHRECLVGSLIARCREGYSDDGLHRLREELIADIGLGNLLDYIEFRMGRSARVLLAHICKHHGSKLSYSDVSRIRDHLDVYLPSFLREYKTAEDVLGWRNRLKLRLSIRKPEPRTKPLNTLEEYRDPEALLI